MRPMTICGVSSDAPPSTRSPSASKSRAACRRPSRRRGARSESGSSWRAVRRAAAVNAVPSADSISGSNVGIGSHAHVDADRARRDCCRPRARSAENANSTASSPVTDHVVGAFTPSDDSSGTLALRLANADERHERQHICRALPNPGRAIGPSPWPNSAVGILRAAGELEGRRDAKGVVAKCVRDDASAIDDEEIGALDCRQERRRASAALRPPSAAFIASEAPARPGRRSTAAVRTGPMAARRRAGSQRRTGPSRRFSSSSRRPRTGTVATSPQWRAMRSGALVMTCDRRRRPQLAQPRDSDREHGEVANVLAVVAARIDEDVHRVQLSLAEPGDLRQPVGDGAGVCGACRSGPPGSNRA